MKNIILLVISTSVQKNVDQTSAINISVLKRTVGVYKASSLMP